MGFTRSRSRSGVTLIELLLAMGLFGLLSLFLYRTTRLHKLAWVTVEKLDALQQLRLAEARLRSELELGTAVLYPRPDASAGDAVARRAVFCDGLNRPRILYLTPEGRLCIRAHDEPPTVLAEGVMDLAVRHPLRGFLLCEITMKADDEDQDRILCTTVAVTAGNAYHGEGRPPAGLPGGGGGS